MIKSYLEIYHQQLDDARAILQLDPMWNNLADDEKAEWVRSIAIKSADQIVASQAASIPPLAPLPIPIDLNAPLSIQSARELQEAVGGPLITNALPVRFNLASKFEIWESAIAGLPGGVRVQVLGNSEITNLAPVLLGQLGLKGIQDRLPQVRSWEAFKQLVDDEYGQSTKESLKSFFRMARGYQETETAFVLRVEAERRMLGADEFQTWLSFGARLGPEFQHEMAQLEKQNAMKATPAEANWKAVVRLAQHLQSLQAAPAGDAGQLPPPPPLTHTPAVPFPAVIQSGPAPPAPIAPHQSAPPPQSDPRPAPICSYCKQRGLTHTHSERICFINPTSLHYKPALAKRRLEAAKKDTANFAPGGPPCSTGYDLEAHLQELRDMGVDEHLLNELREAGGPAAEPAVECVFLARHLEDGLDDTIDPAYAWQEAAPEVIAQKGETTEALIASVTEAAAPQFDVLGYLERQIGRSSPSREDRLAQVVEDDLDTVLQLAGVVQGCDMPLALDAAFAEMGVQTGGVPGAGRLVNKKNPLAPKDLQTVVARLRTSMPLLQAAKLDIYFRQYLLSQLILMNYHDNKSVVVPRSTVVQETSHDNYKKMMAAFAGLTGENASQVLRELHGLGLGPNAELAAAGDAKRLRPEFGLRDSDMTEETRGDHQTSRAQLNKEFIKILASAVAKILSPQQATQAVDTLCKTAEAQSGSTQDPSPATTPPGRLPAWAATYQDFTGLLQYTPEQYVALVGINNSVTEAILDTGGEKSMIDHATAERLGMRYLRARGSEFGKYLSPGNVVTPYYGLVRGPLTISFDGQVSVTIPFLKVISHGEPLLLIGADCLRGGRPLTQWNFTSIGARTVAVGKAEGYVEFTKSGVDRRIPLINAPAGVGDRSGMKLHPKQMLFREVPAEIMLTPGTAPSPAARTLEQDRKLREAEKMARNQGDNLRVSQVRFLRKKMLEKAANPRVTVSYKAAEVEPPAPAFKGARPTFAAGTPQSDMRKWLSEYKMLEAGMTDAQVEERYARFRQVEFPAAPRAEWPRLFSNLLTLENSFAARQTDIGCARAHTFDFKLDDPTPIPAKPTPYGPTERQWIGGACKDLEEVGVVQAVFGYTPYLCNIVLVQGGQSGQDFRMCQNFVKLNAQSPDVVWPLLDCQQAIDVLHLGKVFTGLDIKAGFHNIPLSPRVQEYASFITQDGKFKPLRMLFGMKGAPAHFQKVMQLTVQMGPGDNVVIYIDDVVICGGSWQEVWEKTMIVLTRLSKAGFMINLNKCKFLTSSIEAVGYEVANGTYRPKQKKLQVLLNTQIPKNLRDVQRIAGQLNYFKKFIPDFQTHFKPIKALLSRSNDGKWTQDCHRALTNLCEILARRLCLHIFKPGQPLFLYVAIDENGGGCILCQDEGGSHLPVAILGRELTPSELGRSEVESLLALVHWSLRKLRVYTQFTHTTIFLPEASMFKIIKDKEVHHSIRAKVLDLQAYPHSFALGKAAWKLGAEYIATFPRVLSLEGLPVFEPGSIERPSAATRSMKVLKAPHLKAYFDGGCSAGLGSGGFVVYGTDGEQVGGQALYWGKQADTNNEAEMSALLALLTWVKNNQDQLGHAKMLHVIGDSELIINFMNRAARANKPSLMRKVTEAGKLKRQMGMKVIFSHTLREGNQVADWLSHQATPAQPVVSLEELGVKTKPGGPAPGNDAVQADFQAVARVGILPFPVLETPCRVCGGAQNPSATLLCDGCNGPYHTNCIGMDQVPLIPWHCSQCLSKFKQEGIQDITLDAHLMHYVFHRTHVRGLAPIEQNRVERAARWLSVNADGCLVTVEQSGRIRMIPAIAERGSILDDFHSTGGYCSGDRLYGIVSRYFYWAGLRESCLDQARTAPPNRKERAKFLPHYSLFPPWKGTAPFQQWVLDCIVGLPPNQDGATSILIAIDPFSKWVEAMPLKSRQAGEVAVNFHRQIMCRYGRPILVRTDQGTEFKGSFQEYCDSYGIKVRRINTAAPRGQGQVERVIKTIKGALRKLMSEEPHTTWDDHMEGVLISLRMLPTRAHGFTPYEIIFKQEPAFPALTIPPHCEDEEDFWADDRTEADLTWQLTTLWRNIRPQVIAKLRWMDVKAKEKYEEKRILELSDIQHQFDAGDAVLLMQRRIGKLLPKATGPFTFIKYLGPLKLTAVIREQNDTRPFREIKCSSAHLVPA